MGFFKRLGGAVSHGIYGYFSSIRDSWLNALRVNDDNLAGSRRRVLGFNVIANIVSMMINGNFYTGLLLMVLKGQETTVQNSYIGTVASIATACGMVQILAPALIERLHSVRRYVHACRFVYYLFNVVGLAVVPLLPLASEVKIWLFIGMVIVMQVAAAIQGPAVSVWHIQSLTEAKRSDYFTISNMLISLINAGVGILFTLLVDQMKANSAELTGILLLRGAAILLIALEFKVNNGVWEQPRDVGERLKLSQIFTAPFRHPRFLVFVLIAAIWSFTCGIAGQYFAVYLLQDAGASYTFLQFVGIFSLPCLLIMTPVWNRIIKKVGWLYAMAISMALYSFPQLFNMLIGPKTLWIYPVLCIYSNLVAPGLNLAFANLPYQRCPEEAKSSCLAFYSTASSLAALLGNLFGKFFVQLTEGHYLYLFGFQISNRLYHYFISFGLLLGLAIFIALIQRADNRRERLSAPAETQAEPGGKI